MERVVVNPILVVCLIAPGLAFAQPPIELRERLAAYEKQAATSGKPDAPALAAIARDVVTFERRSSTFRVWSEACGVTLVPDSDRCGPRLLAVLNDTNATLADRSEAAAALMARGDKIAAEKLAKLLAGVPVSSLARLTPIVSEMPAPLAVPVLTRLAESASKADQSAACQAFSRFDTVESRSAIGRVLQDNAPGSEPWLLCMIARARLRDEVPPAAVWGYGHTLQGEGLLFTARVMVETSNDAAAQTLTDLTRRGLVADRVAAADLLAGLRPEIAIPVIESAQVDRDPAVRAAALEAERRLKRTPAKTVRAMLADPSPLVAIRAAEDLIDWANRLQKR